MATTPSLAVVGVFSDPSDAQQAITALRRAGFQDDQIGIAARQLDEPATSEITDLRPDAESGETYAGEGAVTGMAAGAGLGALVGVAILAGMLPPIGPAVAGGTLAFLLSSAATGAAAVGLAGALAGLGVSKEEAEFFESEFHAGRVVVAVTARGREQEARSIIKNNGGYDMSERDELAGTAPPVTPATMSAAEARTPVAMPMEPGVPANVNLAGEPIESAPRAQVDVPVRSEDLIGADDSAERRSTVRVPVRHDDLEAKRTSPPST